MYFPRFINRVLITWFGCGRVPVAPGTAGSIGALPLCWVLAQHTSIAFRVVVAAGATALAILGSAQDQMESREARDPQYIVVDEVAGMLWTTLLAPAAWLPMLVGFGLFRLFDVVKPYPASFFDRRSKTSTSAFDRGACIVLDDVAAGIYSLILLQILIVFVFPRFT